MNESQLRAKILQSQSTIAQMKDELNQSQKRIGELRTNIENGNIALERYTLVASGFEMSKVNIMVVNFSRLWEQYHTNKTLTIFELFLLDRDKKFLCIEDIGRYFHNKVHHAGIRADFIVDLIIAKQIVNSNILLRDSHNRLTPSYIRSDDYCKSWNDIMEFSLDVAHPSDRCRFVKNEIRQILSHYVMNGYPQPPKNMYLPFEYPCAFDAQSPANRTGYGNEYCGEDCIHQGTEYGETRSYPIIGVIFR